MTASRLFDRSVIRLAPQDAEADVTAFLQGLLTNDVAGNLPVYAALLTPQGKAMFDMFVWPAGGGDILLDCETDAAQELVKRLSLYRLRRKIDIAIDDTLAVHWQLQPGTGGAADPRLASLGQRWIAPVDDTDEPADDAYRAHRLSLGVTEGRAELGDILWLETNAADLNGVAFDKGCYIGQENTARMNWRQKINRRLVVVPLDQAEEKRSRASYPELDLAVVHMRVADIDGALAPDWMRESLNPSD